MTLKAKLLSALFALIGMAAAVLIFMAWRQGGLTLLQLDIGLC